MVDRVKEVTQLLGAVSAGNEQAIDALFPLVYEELRSVAADRLRGERIDHTLQPTALVHEAYLRLAGEQRGWSSYRYFFAAAAEAMRRILVEHARGRNRLKRGGGGRSLQLDTVDAACQDEMVDWLAMDEALDALRSEDERLSNVVHLRFFAGLSVDETAIALEISPRTVKRDWRYAKAFLLAQMSSASES